MTKLSITTQHNTATTTRVELLYQKSPSRHQLQQKQQQQQQQQQTTTATTARTTNRMKRYERERFVGRGACGSGDNSILKFQKARSLW